MQERRVVDMIAGERSRWTRDTMTVGVSSI
jgi:hypothetical protein